MQTSHEDIVLDRRAVVGEQRRTRGAFVDIDDLRRRIAVDGRQGREARLDAQPAVFDGPADDKGATALSRIEKAVALQEIDGLADRDPRNAELLCKVLICRQARSDGPNAACDPLADGVSDLRIFRHMALGRQLHCGTPG